MGDSKVEISEKKHIFDKFGETVKAGKDFEEKAMSNHKLIVATYKLDKEE